MNAEFYFYVHRLKSNAFIKREFNFIAELWQYVQEIEILFVDQIYSQNNRGKLEIWDAPVCLSFTPELTSWPRCKQSSSVNGSESIFILLDLTCWLQRTYSEA